MMLTRTTFEQALSTQRLRAMQIIHAALMGGPLLFLAVLALLAQGDGASVSPPNEESLETVTLLSVVHAVFAFGSFGAGVVLFGRIFNPQRLEWPDTPGQGSDQGQSALALLQTALLLRMGLLEGASMLGLAVCMIAWTNGVLPREEVYWLNAGSVVLLLGVGVWLFPSKEKVLSLFDRHVAGVQ